MSIYVDWEFLYSFSQDFAIIYTSVLELANIERAREGEISIDESGKRRKSEHFEKPSPFLLSLYDQLFEGL